MANILVVEDSYIQRKNLVKFLKSLGHRVLEAENGESALNLLSQGRDFPDFVISDFWMPGINARVMLESFVQRKINIKTLLISSSFPEFTEKQIKELNIIGKLTKPLFLKDIVSFLK